MRVTSVRGPVEAGDLGLTLAHEHVLIDLYRVTSISDHLLDDPELAASELSYFKAAGGQSLVDLTSDGIGRNPLALRRISEQTGVHIVMGSGWYREPYYPQYVYTTSTNALAAMLIREIEEGVGDTAVRPGVIGEIGTEKDRFTPAMERVFRAAARAHVRTGLPIFTHTSAGTLALEQLELLKEEGVDLRRVVIGHADGRTDHDYHLAIARTGACVGFDRVGRQLIGGDGELHVAAIRRMAEAGLLSHVLISQNVSLKSQLRAFGGAGYDHLLTVFVPRLRAAGLADEQIAMLLVDNPRRILSIQD
jgi:phosphotriesterase-related protein